MICLWLELASFNTDIAELRCVVTNFVELLITPLQNRSNGNEYECISDQIADMYQTLFTLRKRLALS